MMVREKIVTTVDFSEVYLVAKLAMEAIRKKMQSMKVSKKFQAETDDLYQKC